MNKDVLNEVIAKTKEVMKEPYTCDELKVAAQAWLDAIGTEAEAEETKKYFLVLEESIVPIDDLIHMATSEEIIQNFGAETAKNIENHAKEIKAAGAKFCDCSACSIVATILEMKDKLI